MKSTIKLCTVAFLLSASAAAPAQTVESSARRCEALQGVHLAIGIPDARIESAHWIVAGVTADMGRGAVSPPLAAHCDVTGIMQERDGTNGQHYAIRFHIRLPETWNNRFLFQGGGGSDGDIGNALGPTGPGNPPALSLGYAVVSGDSGHDNKRNNDPAHGGVLAFGFDPQARRNYGFAALKPTYDAAQAVMKTYYGRAPRRNYYFGCSKGGQEGMAFAQKYPQSFDGIVAAAPGFSLPRAALAEAWNTQAFARVANAPITIASVAESFSTADLNIAKQAILDACDAADGVKDGIIANFRQCTSAKVLRALKTHECAIDKSAECLTSRQITALAQVMQGAHDSMGKPLYAAFPWDTGLSEMGWRMWQLGDAGKMPALNIILGGGSLASVFTVPPTALPADPKALLKYQLAFNFDRDARKITALGSGFKTSAWEDISARSADLKAFQQHGGKLIVPHGVSDPVFSVNDTLAWWNEVNAQSKGKAASFTRVFPVPGMTHCGGGSATDLYDSFGALVKWVEEDQAPVRIEAKAGANTPWPGRTRPLCAYPQTAQYRGKGDVERSENFICAQPHAITRTK